MKYISSGIKAATVAWHPLGWKPVAFAVMRWIGERIEMVEALSCAD